jgi:hypothetical protein
LTSDALCEVFESINRMGHIGHFGDRKVVGCQVSHHGSINNYFGTFWRLMKHDQNSIAFISVGVNSYGHPSAEVIEKIRNYNYSIEQTTEWNNLAPSSDLDMISDAVAEVGVVLEHDITFHL